MAKIILEFDLSEGCSDAELALAGGRLYSALWDMDQDLRNIVKYGREGWDIEQAQLCRERLHQILENNRVDLDAFA